MAVHFAVPEVLAFDDIAITVVSVRATVPSSDRKPRIYQLAAVGFQVVAICRTSIRSCRGLIR